MIEISQLHTLTAVCSAGSFSKAAQRLHVTQSAISQSIKNLEGKLGVQLVKRNGKTIVLTQEGEQLFKFAHKFLNDLDNTVDQIKTSKDQMSGHIRVGTLTGIGKSWLTPELLDFTLKNPCLSTTITLGFQEDLVSSFKNHLLDILVLPQESLPTVGERVFLSEEKSTLIFPKKWPQKIHEKMTLDELSEVPTILFEEDDPLYFKWCVSKFGHMPKKVNTKFVVNAHGNIIHAVAQGLGIAVVPNHVLIRSHLLKDVATLGPSFEVSNGKFYLVYHRESANLMRIKMTMNHLLSIENPLGTPLIQ